MDTNNREFYIKHPVYNVFNIKFNDLDELSDYLNTKLRYKHIVSMQEHCDGSVTFVIRNEFK